MKIGNKPDLPQSTAAAKQAPKSATAIAAEESTKGLPEKAAGVPVSFSSSARALDNQGRASADFDTERVKAMREAIANGTFRVNAEAVADKLLANTEEFLVHARG
ncbi:MAG: flagellar biosynthesis anti-sigma factor FlgM [Comamonas sp.]|jgi:negative regulator of flagellin synthesis FlgM|uniref:flagellar biosynthesis anti-sigma factor FlgM n=1 Tax=Comamonas sp. TaxID=34028 RepID=UPI00281A8D5A|nr:flagellar biosynthesis anti-sigma factor FlgM [Comamonas sp.]MDR0213303.1 flagellar biosynthesis anti-sigma factor FlgM [Comamonas sp.]MDR2300370.1 flagellar biosynthesis anti-sigma factor FlgM [Comamonas sp.]